MQKLAFTSRKKTSLVDCKTLAFSVCTWTLPSLGLKYSFFPPFLLSSPCGSSCRASQILLKHSKSCLLNLNPCTVVCILYLILALYYVTTPFISNLLENSPSLHTFFEAPHWHIVQGFLPLQSSALCFHGFFFVLLLVLTCIIGKVQI